MRAGLRARLHSHMVEQEPDPKLIAQARIVAVAHRIIEHFEAKCDLAEKCEECETYPITAGEITAFFKAVKDAGIEWVAPDAPAAPAKPKGSVAWPREKTG